MPILSTIGAASYRGFVTQSYGTIFSASYLVAGGGGSGGNNWGGGGGAGGVVIGTVSLKTGTSYVVTIGAGGPSVVNSPTAVDGNTGSNSIFYASPVITAYGGQGGASADANPSQPSSGSGGGGGGDAYNTTGGTAYQPSPSGGTGYANNGGSYTGGTTFWHGGNGGGGAGSIGGSSANGSSGNGGSGISSSITGTAIIYAGGGGGGGYPGRAPGGSGGSGGGGAGGGASVAERGYDATYYGSGGGGAAGGVPSTETTGAGYQGIALISSPYVAAVSSLTGSPTIIGLPSFTNYSGSFNGSNQYLTVGTNSNWTFLNNGSSNFTVECWFNVTSTSSVYTIVSTDATTISTGMTVALNGYVAGDVYLEIYKNTSGICALKTNDAVGNRFSINTWNHLAVVYNSSTSVGTVYMNGVSILTATGSGFSSSAPTYTLAIGRYQVATPGGYLSGYINNLRITNTAVYTSAFTPSTVPLTAITGTQLLTLQNATITDTSTNAYTITNNGSVTTTSTVQPFPQAPITSYVYKFTSSGSLTYTTNTFLNYAASFNGTNQYLSFGNLTNLQMGTGDYTVEFWIYQNSVSTGQVLMEIGRVNASSLTPGFQFYETGGIIYVYGGSADNTLLITSGSTQVASTWYHIALTRASSSTKLFINGTQSGSTVTDTTNYNQAYTWIGVNGGGASAWLNGYISNVRVIKGTALYTSNFTPPTTHLTAVSGTQLLTCQNAALVDNSLNNFAITNNNTVTTTYTTVPFNY